MAIEIATSDLVKIDGDSAHFVAFIRRFANDCFDPARLLPIFSEPRLIDAHREWVRDLKRIGDHEPELSDGLNHYKRCGHLAFWVRRASPVVEANDFEGNMTDPLPMTDRQKKFRKFLEGYSNEYLAFELGFQFCLRFEIEQKSPRAGLRIDDDYIRTICYFMKFKNVSPPSMSLIYKSLFVR